MTFLLEVPANPSKRLIMATFGETLKQLREDADLTQEELAERAGLTHVAISDWERGRRSPRRTSLELIARALRCTSKEKALLYAAAGYAEPNQPEQVEYIVNLDELTPEGYNDYDDMPPAAREHARTVATQAAKTAFKSIADAIREVRRDSPGTVGGAGPVDEEKI